MNICDFCTTPCGNDWCSFSSKEKLVVKTLVEYNNSWTKFRMKVEKKAKGRCKLTNKNWKCLKDFHFETFIGNALNKEFFIQELGMFHFLPERKEKLDAKKVPNRIGRNGFRLIPSSHRRI